jgi:hypothetical protein
VILKQDDQQAIQLFDWSGIAAARVDTLEQRFTSLLAHYRSAEDTIRQLNVQLEDLISAKNQHEEQLVANFVQLLNEKKLKIRNQQRLLASAKVDLEKGEIDLEIVQHGLTWLTCDYSHSVSGYQNAIPGRHSQTSKEVWTAKRAARELNYESEDGFEKMEVDQTTRSKDLESNGTDDVQLLAPQPLEEGDDDIAIDEGSPTPSVAASSEDEKHDSEFKRSYGRPVMKEPTPPRRELPFARKIQATKGGSKAQVYQQEDIADETAGETDDDEL